MLIEGVDNIKATKAEVWRFFTDAKSLSQCAPGVESMEILEPEKKFNVVGALRLGSVKVKVRTVFEWIDLQEPDVAKMKMHGTAPGSSIDVNSEIHFSDGATGSTNVSWKADVHVVGSIASLASRLMKPVTEKMTGEFFSCVKRQIEM